MKILDFAKNAVLFSIAAFMLFMALAMPSPGYAMTLEKAIVDVTTPVSGLDKFQPGVNASKLTIAPRLKFSLVDINEYRFFGVDLRPVYTMDNQVLGGTVGLYIRPVKYIEVYLDHAHDFNLGGGGAAHDANMMGIRLTLKDM